jgi:hypothetical protein
MLGERLTMRFALVNGAPPPTPKKPLANSLLIAFISLMSEIQVSQALMRVP